MKTAPAREQAPGLWRGCVANAQWARPRSLGTSLVRGHAMTSRARPRMCGRACTVRRTRQGSHNEVRVG